MEDWLRSDTARLLAWWTQMSLYDLWLREVDNWLLCNKWLLLSLVATLIICGRYWWIAYRGNKKAHGLRSEWWRLVHIVLAAVILLVLFSVAPLRPTGEYRNISLPDSTACDIGKTDRAACEKLKLKLAVAEVFKFEAQKVQNEISERLNHVDEWFHYKFILVGVLIAAFFTHVVKENIASVRGLENLLKSSLCCIVVAIACTVAIAVDIHIRNDIVAIQQLGSWLAYQAEPHMSGIPFENDSILFWEKFLRQGGGMHTDQLYRYTFYPHLHFLTWVVYVLYLWIFQNMCVTHENGNTSNCWIVFGTFCLVHASFLAFVFIATQSPSQFEFQPITWANDAWLTPLWTFTLYAMVLLILITVSARYIVMLIKTCNACLSPEHRH